MEIAYSSRQIKRIIDVLLPWSFVASVAGDAIYEFYSNLETFYFFY
jgi:hypothetical protein